MQSSANLRELSEALRLKRSKLSADIRTLRFINQPILIGKSKNTAPDHSLLASSLLILDSASNIISRLKIHHLPPGKTADDLKPGTIIKFTNRYHQLSYAIVSQVPGISSSARNYLRLLSSPPSSQTLASKRHLHLYFTATEISQAQLVAAIILDPIKDIIIRLGLLFMVIIIIIRLIEIIFQADLI